MPSSRPRLAAAALLAGLAACRTAAPLPPAAPFRQAPVDDRPPKVALVLGGGGARGFAHVGVIQVLEEEGIPVELIVGTSVGSLVGALYSTRTSGAELERSARTLERSDFFDFGLAPALFGTGLARGERLQRFVRDHVPERRIEELRIPYAAVATDLDTGETVVLRDGDLAGAVRASCAIPGVFEPVEREGHLLVDGGTTLNLPVRVAREMGADVVIAVDLSAVEPLRPPANFVEVILRAVNIRVHGEVEAARRDADVLLTPRVGTVGLVDFDRKDEAIAAGVAAAREALPRIRRALAAAAARYAVPSPARAPRAPGNDPRPAAVPPVAALLPLRASP